MASKSAVSQPFPIDFSDYRLLSFDLSKAWLSEDEQRQLQKNIALKRAGIVFFTANAGAKGLSGHTGGAYDIIPEAEIIQGFIRGHLDSIYPDLFDAAGHRVALQYMNAALVFGASMQLDDLLHHREFDSGLFGHPERNEGKINDGKRKEGGNDGISFSSGRLGHLESYVNGIALAHRGKSVVLFTSDGSLQEGNAAEAARFAVAHRLPVKWFVDDNDVTISGHPSEYQKGFDVQKTLGGHGFDITVVSGEDLEALHEAVRYAFVTEGPIATIVKRPMAPGIKGIEGTCKGHDVIDLESAVAYLSEHGHDEAVAMLSSAVKVKPLATEYLGSSAQVGTPRKDFGKVVADILEARGHSFCNDGVLVIDNDLEGSCGLAEIRKRFSVEGRKPDWYIEGGVMERNAFSTAAGFGSSSWKQGITGTFSAFVEMLSSEITMARLNQANVLAHFSHAGVDWMADNTCHFGVNNFFADTALADGDNLRLYFPADSHQMKAVVEKIFDNRGLRFVFSTRSDVPYILDETGKNFFDPANGYKFVPGRDEVIREGTDGYIVSYGDMLHRSLDAVERMRQEGKNVGLINKPCLNVVDEGMMRKLAAAPFVMIVESQSEKTGLGVRFGTWLLENGFRGAYSHIGVNKSGNGGLYEQIPHQGLDPKSILDRTKDMYLRTHDKK